MQAHVTIDVRKPTIQEFLDDLKAGDYLLPSFQRLYQWDEDDIKDLIDSIVQNYPIGTIILWKPSAARPNIDPFAKRLLGTGRPNGQVSYVIDGQQRLTSLLLLFNGWKIRRESEEISVGTVSYNPTNGKFYKSETRGIDLSKAVRAFYDFDADVINELKRSTPAPAYKELGALVKAILRYPLPVYVMETEGEDESTFQKMAEAFIRVNKYGIRIGNLELMLSFLAGAISGELKQRTRRIYEEGYAQFEMDLQPAIRFVFGNFGLRQTQISRVEQFRANVSRISAHKPKERSRIFNTSRTALLDTFSFLRGQLGVGTAALLPSQTPLVTLAKYFLTHPDKVKRNRKRLADWFLLTTFKGYYSAQTDTKLDRDLDSIAGSSLAGLFNNLAERLPSRYISFDDLRRGLNSNVLRAQGRSYLFVLYSLLACAGADDWNGTLIRMSDLKNLARHHIFPKEYLDQNLDIEDSDAQEVLINNLANITFIHKDINAEIGDTPPDEYLHQYLAGLPAHFIPTDTALWSLENYQAFLDHRMRQIHTKAKQLFPGVFT